LEVGNTLAFDAERLSTLNIADLLMKVTKSVVIHGYSFVKALEHAIKECAALGKHTNILHITPSDVTRYVWAHRDYQPWGTRLSIQCSQCGTLNPWSVVAITVNQCEGYKIECKNTQCSKAGGRRIKPACTFQVMRPENSTIIHVGTGCSWLKI
jgi:hypothetical protein